MTINSRCVYIYIDLYRVLYLYFKLNTIILCSNSSNGNQIRRHVFPQLFREGIIHLITILFSIIYENSGVPRLLREEENTGAHAPFHSIKNTRAYQFLFKREAGFRKYNIRRANKPAATSSIYPSYLPR